MGRFARLVYLAGRYASQADFGSFNAPYGAVAIPNAGGRACERLTIGNSRSRKNEESKHPVIGSIQSERTSAAQQGVTKSRLAAVQHPFLEVNH